MLRNKNKNSTECSVSPVPSLSQNRAEPENFMQILHGLNPTGNFYVLFSITIYPLQRVFYPPKFGLYPKKWWGPLYIYIESIKKGIRSNAPPILKCSGNPESSPFSLFVHLASSETHLVDRMQMSYICLLAFLFFILDLNWLLLLLSFLICKLEQSKKHYFIISFLSCLSSQVKFHFFMPYIIIVGYALKNSMFSYRCVCNMC